MSGAGSARQFVRALMGNESAMRALAKQGLRRYNSKLHGLDREVRRHGRDTWDIEAAQNWALDPETEVDPAEFAAAWDAINYRVTALLTGSVTLLFGDPQASQAAETEMRRLMFELFLLLANPDTRYTLIAGLDPELRHIADDELTTLGREAWGTILALSADSVDLEDFPPDVAANIAALAEQRAEFLESNIDIEEDLEDD